MDLTDKKAIVTGAGRGLGKSISEWLCKNGVHVYGISRTPTDLEEIRKKYPDTFHSVCIDLTGNEVTTWFEDTFQESYYPEILIQNAGIIHHGSIEQTSLDDWNSVMDLNLNAVFKLTKLCLPLMKSGGKPAHIIHVASIAGLMGNAQLSLYNASKFALRGFSEALMKEVRSFGIKVTCLFPGSIDTKLFDKSDSFKGATNKMNPDEIAALIGFILQTSDNFLIDEITMRPLIPTK